MKNVVVCCDGTANEFAADKTNVLRLFMALERSERQTASYFPGIGTMEPPGALTNLGRRVTRGLARAVGYGLETEIRSAYTFIMDHFEAGDALYLFGFSRGAYTVRAVASLLRMYGLLPTTAKSMTPYAIRLLTSLNDSDDTSRWFNLARDFRSTFPIIECKPHFVGVWDTVSSVGWIANPLRLPYTASNSDIGHGRHAVSIDERRAFFRSNLWSRPKDNSGQDLKQVWFAGVHADVGGGYPEAESGLSKISLEWMMREAQACGLLLDEVQRSKVLGLSGGEYAPADPNAKMHVSLRQAWWLGEIVPKSHWDGSERSWKINLAKRRTVPENALVHTSVRDRDGYRPMLPDTATFVS